ncbi:SH3 domain-containing protein [bacterium]|nr:SH3 domain-containing protein [FCB group bacterium]MBL7190807.1 SH3 domain-containing protein [bacterium]
MAKRIIICLILPLFLQVSWAAAEPADAVYATAFSVNIRSGPGLNYNIVGVTFVNEPLEVLAVEKEWTEIIKGDTLDGWITNKYISKNKVSTTRLNELYYLEGLVPVKLSLVERLTKEHSGPGFELLKRVILNHADYELGAETDRILLPAIFNGWRDNKVTEAIPVLISMMERGLSGQCGASTELMRELKISAKEAIEELVRR